MDSLKDNIIIKIEFLKNKFKDNINDYFFTEKELHSYFYHLFVDDPSFITKDGFNLVHTEYPTPFKCATLKEIPYITIAPKDSNNQRAHIDFIILNPNYIEWILSHKNTEDNDFKMLYKSIIGIGNKLFDSYIKQFYSIYNKFMMKYNESILIFAIEFKFLRHSYIGIKYPIIGIMQDIEKLRLLKHFNCEFNNNTVPYTENVLSLIFIGERQTSNQKEIINQLAGMEDYYMMIGK